MAAACDFLTQSSKLNAPFETATVKPRILSAAVAEATLSPSETPAMSNFVLLFQPAAAAVPCPFAGSPDGPQAASTINAAAAYPCALIDSSCTAGGAPRPASSPWLRGDAGPWEPDVENLL